MTDDGVLMRLHVEALFDQDEQSRLLAVNDPGGAAAPRFFLGRTLVGNLWWFGKGVDPTAIEELTRLSETLSTALSLDPDPRATAAFVECLSRTDPVLSVQTGPAYRFPDDLAKSPGAVTVTPGNTGLLNKHLGAWENDLPTCAPMVVVLEGDNAVSVCGSVRVTDRAHEAGVETHPDFRGRGYAARTVSAWALAVRGLDCIPLYSTSWANYRSRALARKLGLIQFGADLHIA